MREGETVPADGQVVKGQGSVDESALTGEAAPVGKKKEDVVSGGTVLQSGYVEWCIISPLSSSIILCNNDNTSTAHNNHQSH